MSSALCTKSLSQLGSLALVAMWITYGAVGMCADVVYGRREDGHPALKNQT
jgi:hypothetical protein